MVLSQYGLYNIVWVIFLIKIVCQLATMDEYCTVKRVFHSGGGMRGAPSHPVIFSKNPLSKLMPSMGCPHLKMKPPPIEKYSLLPENDSQKKNPKIRNCHSYLCFTHKTALEKDEQKFHKNVIFSLGAYQIFVRKVKQFIRKYYIT